MIPTLLRMARSKTYSEAVKLLNTCQSNAETIEAIRKSGGRLNDWAIAEMHDYLRRIGYVPEDLNKLNVVHISGTKGKGSTSAFVERILREHVDGKVGLYTSPHLCAVRERIRINGEPLSEEEFAKYFFEVWERLEADPKTLTEHTPVFPIYFRLMTLLAFHTFLSLGVQATVLEVGIGGTYDSTNIVPQPIVTGVAALGMDHIAVLGNTIEEIAKNKAGIFKKGVPAFSVPQTIGGGEVLETVAKDVGAPFEWATPIPPIPLGLRGAHQQTNASLAVTLARSFLTQTNPSSLTPIPSSSNFPLSFAPCLAHTKWPGRCQAVPSLTAPSHSPLTWLLDGAHTVESLTSCAEWCWDEHSPNVLIFNCSGGRDTDSLLGTLLAAGAKMKGLTIEEIGARFDTILFCTNVTYADGNFKGDLTSAAIDVNDLAQLATQHTLRDTWLRLVPSFPTHKVHALPSIQHAVQIVNDLILPTSIDGEKQVKQVLVAGSLHLVGGVMEVAGLQHALSMV